MRNRLCEMEIHAELGGMDSFFVNFEKYIEYLTDK